jgi:hypothetical protein
MMEIGSANRKRSEYCREVRGAFVTSSLTIEYRYYAERYVTQCNANKFGYTGIAENKACTVHLQGITKEESPPSRGRGLKR